MLVIHPLPKGCGEYEAYWRTIPELEVVSCDNTKAALRLMGEYRPDSVVYHPSNAKKGRAFLQELRDTLHVSVRYMPHVFFLCRDGERQYVSWDGGQLLRAAKLPSAAWFAKYALLDLHIREGCFSYTAPLSLEEIRAGIHSRLVKLGIHIEEEKPFEAATVYAMTFFQNIRSEMDAFEAAAQELGWGQGAFLTESYTGKYLDIRQTVSDVLYGMWEMPYTIRKSTVPCSPIAKELADAEWHKHMRIAGSPVQIGGEACDDEA